MLRENCFRYTLCYYLSVLCIIEFSDHALTMAMISCTNQSYVGVSRPWDYQYGRDIQTSASRSYMMLSKEYEVSCCGYITGWEFQASIRAQIRPIEFQVWRPMSTDRPVFLLIGQHTYWFTKEKSRTVTVTLRKEEQILVNPGDVLGWNSPMGDVLDYTIDSSSSLYRTQKALNVTVGQTVALDGPVASGRKYGIKAILSSGELKTASLLQGNITSDITVTLTSTCDLRTSAELTLQCIDYDFDVNRRKDNGQLSTETSRTSLSSDASSHHMVFKESVTSETILGTLNLSKTADDVTVCTITDTQPHVSANVLYTSGNIVLMKSNRDILYNTSSVINVSLVCRLADNSAVEEKVVIHVIKDLEPAFDNLPAVIHVSATYARINDVVYHINATDNEGQILTYGTINCSCPFLVKVDGSVTVTDDLRKYVQPSYTLSVFISDGFNTAGPQNLTVVLTDANRPPVFIHLSHEVIVPESSKGIILTVQPYDPDKQDDIKILWAWEQVQAVSFFTFNETSYQLQVSPMADLDYEYLLQVNQTSFTLLLTVTDGALTSDTERVNIRVINVNEGPQFTVPVMNISHDEGKAGTVILDTQIKEAATDPDVGDILFFDLVDGNLTHMFSVRRETGKLWFSSDYDTDPNRLPNQVTLWIQVSDAGDLRDILQIHFFVQNINRAPVVSAPSSVTVSENLPGGSVVFVAVASDWDTADVLTMTVMSADRSSLYFSVVESGSVILAENASLDYETTPLFTLQVHADDGQLTSKATFVLLYVTNVNEVPYCTRDSLSITAFEGKEGVMVSSIDLRDIFTDPDNDELIFSIQENNGTDWSLFAIDSHSGWLFLACDVDVTRQTTPKVSYIHVSAKDPGNLSAEIKIKINLHFLNTEPVLFGLPTQITVFENQRHEDAIFKVMAKDEDTDDVVLKVSPLAEGDILNFGFLNVTDGEIRISTSPVLSQGETVKLSLVITAFDGELTSEDGLLNITIVGVNDPPRFPKAHYTFIINETQVGHYLDRHETWSKLDPDPADNLTYMIIGGSGEDHVSVTMVTGNLIVNDYYDIDDEGSTNNLTVILMVTDSHGLNATTTVTIIITDINDNSPVVENDGETFFLYFNATGGHRVGLVTATDLDSGKNSALTFSLVGSTLDETSDCFVMSSNGWIMWTGVIPTDNHVTLYISVSDGGWPSNVVMATVHIIAVDFISGNHFQQSLLQPTMGVNTEGKRGNKSSVLYVSICVIACMCAVITCLSYQLCKAKKTRRSTQPEQDHDAYHEYRFPWIPPQITDSDNENNGEGLPRTTMDELPSFIGSSVTNENFQYMSAMPCSALTQQVSDLCDQSNDHHNEIKSQQMCWQSKDLAKTDNMHDATDFDGCPKHVYNVSVSGPKRISHEETATQF